VEKRKPFCNCGNVNWCSHYENEGSSKKLKTKLPYNLVISLLGIYLNKTKTLI